MSCLIEWSVLQYSKGKKNAHNPMRGNIMNGWSNVQADCAVPVSELLSLKSDQRWDLLRASVLGVEILLWQGKMRLQ